MNSQLYTALDLGSSSIKVIIADVVYEKLNILGVGIVKTNAIKRGNIIDVESASRDIEKALEIAKSEANKDIRSLYVAVPSIHTHIKRSVAEITFDNKHDIDGRDIEEVVEEVKTLPVPRERDVIQVIPDYYRIDDIENIKQPKGMTVHNSFELSSNRVLTSKTHLHTIYKSIEKLKIDCNETFVSSHSLGELLLSDEEKDYGSVIIDIGSGITTVSYYEDNILQLSQSIDLAGDDITRAISDVLNVSMKKAEEIKITQGHSFYDLASNDIIIELDNLEEEELPFTQKELSDYIEEIVEEIILRSFDILRKAGINRIKGNVVLTGGTTLMPGVLELAKDMLKKMNVRLGTPKIIGANSPELSVAVGTLTSSYNIESLFGYQTFGEAVSVNDNYVANFENVNNIEEIPTNNNSIKEEYYEDEYYYEEDDEYEEDSTNNFFTKIKKKYSSFFE
ncbi:cell division protein FtsA [Gemella palaticanis]|uniref:Cell division protein FtsA n=1 Tax=Gemelliphila palaticanis TaxID=81950 RepID=A0ABX2SXN5_9BACL|nr:cell division protein FtsA [Gemella palaticanis]MBF0715028.1 cell division protein FtsA [Gemella palaticanis]NYS46958.1 cell division protein FtsA [Gemella palaticanis]